MKNKISEDYAIIDGMKYIPIEQHGCKGCDLARTGPICIGMHCDSAIRKDKKSVIWKLSTTAGLTRTIRLLKL